MLSVRRLFGFLLFFTLCLPCIAETQSIAQKTAGLQQLDGFFPVSWDAKAGKLYLEIDAFGKDFLFLDSLPYGVGERLQAAEQGSYHLDTARSAISMESTKNFPLNTEVESVLTFAVDDISKAALVASVTPDAHAVTVHE